MKKMTIRIRNLFSLLVFLFPSVIYAQDKPELTLPIGHTAMVNTANFSTDDKKIVTTSYDKTAKVWEVQSGKLIHNLQGHTATVYDADFDPESKNIITISSDNTAKIWNTESGVLICTLIGHTGSLYSAEYSPDGKKIVTSSTDETVKIWDAVTGQELNTLTGHQGIVYYANFSPDGKKIISASDDYTAKVWDAELGTLLFDLTVHEERVNHATFSPDGQQILTASDDGIAKIWSSSDGKLLFDLDDDGYVVRLAAYSPDGKKILTMSFETITVWNASDGTKINSLSEEETQFNYAAFSHNGELIVTASSDRTAKIWDYTNNKVLFQLRGHEGSVRYAVFSYNDKYILTASEDQTAKLWEVKSGELLKTFESRAQEVISASFSNNGRQIISASSHNRNAIIWDFEYGKIIGSLAGHSGDVKSVTYSPDGKLIITASNDSTIKIWDADHLKLLRTIKGHQSTIENAAFSPDGLKVISASCDNTAKLWWTNSGKLIHTFPGHSFYVTYASFSPDGSKIVTGSILDKACKIWNTENGKLIFELKGHNSYLSKAVFNPQSTRLATTYFDSTAIIWDAGSGKIIRKLPKHSDALVFAEYSLGGDSLITATIDGILSIWDIRNYQLLKTINLHGAWLMDIDWAHSFVLSHTNSKLIIQDLFSGNDVCSLIAIDSADWFMITPDNYYYATKNAVKLMSFKLNNKIYGFEQFDLKYNRPDIVLSRMGYASGGLIEAFHKAYLKRLSRMGIKEEDLGGEFHIPESSIKNFEYLPIIEEQNIEIDLNFNDTKYMLDRYNIWVNEVPLYGMNGKSLSHLKTNSFSVTIPVMLSEGRNKIQVSCTNGKGAESFKESVEITYKPKQDISEKVYFIGIGIDHYQQQGHDLNYSVKDIRDIATSLKNKYGSSILIDTLFNSNVSRQNVLALKKKLLLSSVNDKVIISFSGHGLLDKKYDYYLATYNIDFTRPELAGLPYEDLEWLLDSIPARKKLLLIDACHSGEVDKEDLLVMEQAAENKGTKGAAIVYQYNPTLGMKNSFEFMQDLFANINRGTGATVISAAAGTQYALEGGEFKNGVFTYSILELMKTKKEITVSELKEQVAKRVEELTNGAQKPTSRQESLDCNWKVW